MNENNSIRAWYALESKDVIKQLESDSRSGLSAQTAGKRLSEYGPNELPEKKKQSLWIRFFKHFNDILIYILLVAAVVTAMLGEYVDTIVILLVAIINAAIGFFQENKAEKALDNIKNMLSLKAHVIRDGDRREIDASDVTIGDIILLNPGDKIPADARLIETSNLKVEESSLTGESVPSDKEPTILDEDTMLGDRYNMVFSSTTVSAGKGKAIVTAVGEDTEIGKINRMMSEVGPMTTPLLKQTAKFGKTISIVIIAIGVLVYLFGYFFRDYESGELLLSVIGLSIAAVPEGLPAILSIILAIGVQNMAKRNAIIRNLPSVETLGSVSVICSDKTGTLTKNEMTVKKLIVAARDFTVTGTGYAPEGEIRLDDKAIDPNNYSVLKELIECFNFCNDAEIAKNENNHWYVKGEPTEGALITLYEKAQINEGEAERLATIPFDSEYKYMAVLMRLGERRVIYIKGAPDRLLDMASEQKRRKSEEDFDRAFWEEKIDETARKGQRMIGGAYKEVDSSKNDLSHEDIQDDMVFLGLAGLIDPPREEAIEAIESCHQAGITVKMITGDHAETAKAIGCEMGIGDGEKALQGKDLQNMSEMELQNAVAEYDVFARTSPENKLKLVEAIQADGDICAMTGDGVNDAPALKRADVGIAMGIKGTEVTKDASEMVLVDDNFSTIVAAIEEGRRVYDNLKKTILFILPTNGAESFLIIASILFGTLMPLTPVQILWVNMVTSVTISFALAFEKMEPDTMQRPPRSPKTPLLSGYFIWRILFVSLLIGGGTLLLTLYLQSQSVPDHTLKTITLNTIVITQMFHLFNARSTNFAFNKDFFSNKAVFIVSLLLIVLQVSVTYLTFMNQIMGTHPLSAQLWLYPVILGIIVFVVVEIEKAIVRKMGIKAV